MKLLFVFLFLMFFSAVTRAETGIADELLSLVTLNTSNATQSDISSILGQPTSVDEGNKLDKWHYTVNNNELTLYWDNRTAKLEKYSFKQGLKPKKPWDNVYGRMLKTGETKLAQVIKTLGAPSDMSVKTNHQDVHYAFQSNSLHLFFRKGTLINFAFY